VRTRWWIVAIAVVVMVTPSCSVRQVQAWFGVHHRPVPSAAQALTIASNINATAAAGCDENYADACVPDNVLAVHCVKEAGGGPAVAGPVRVVGWDHFGLDPDGDGVACELPAPATPDASASPTAGAAVPAAATEWRTAMLDRVNRERAGAGVAPLKPCSQLDRSAQGHSEDQAARGVLTHSGSDGSTPSVRAADTGFVGTVGEIIAAGYPDVASVMVAWTGSASHRVIILANGSTHLGVGRAASATGVIFWTLDFGAGSTC